MIPRESEGTHRDDRPSESYDIERLRRDLELVTVCVFSVGSPQYEYAIASLDGQRPPVRHWTIRDLSPFGEAFNAMIERATSRYVVQLDEDMELNPNAVEWMLGRFLEEQARDPSVGQMTFRLDDAILGNIAGCKLLDITKVSHIRMCDSLYPDRAYNDSLRKSGVATAVDRGPSVGHHARHRTDYELFLKHVITGSKAFSQRVASPVRGDVERFVRLFHRALSAEPEEAFEMLGGLYWGMFNGISTDVTVYPVPTFEQLRGRSGTFASALMTADVRRLVAECDRIVNEAADEVEEPGFYVKERYYGRWFVSQLRCVRAHPIPRWDLYGLDHGEMALAVSRMGRLGEVWTDSRAARRQYHAVTARLVLESGVVPVDPDAPAPSDGRGLLLPHGCDLSAPELAALVESRYQSVVCDPIRLRKRSVEPDALVSVLHESGGWGLREEDEGILRMDRMAES